MNKPKWFNVLWQEILRQVALGKAPPLSPESLDQLKAQILASQGQGPVAKPEDPKFVLGKSVTDKQKQLYDHLAAAVKYMPPLTLMGYLGLAPIKVPYSHELTMKKFDEAMNGALAELLGAQGKLCAKREDVNLRYARFLACEPFPVAFSLTPTDGWDRMPDLHTADAPMPQMLAEMYERHRPDKKKGAAETP